MLEASKLDGGLVWAATPESGLTSLTDLAGLPSGAIAVAPGFAMTISSGVPVLEVAYDTTLIVTERERRWRSRARPNLRPESRMSARTGNGCTWL